MVPLLFYVRDFGSAESSGLEFIGAPDWFKEGKLALTYGITSVPLAYAPALNDPSDLKFVKEDKPDGPGLATCWKQAEPALFYVKPVDSPAVLVEKVYGGWRLYYTNGGWVKVVRIK